MLETSRLKKNDEIEVLVERLGANGEGIATHDGAVIFVPYALEGERCVVHIVSDKKSYYFAKLVKVLSESKDRVVAPCPYFYKCGGCDLQHMCYQKQLELKHDIVFDDLKKYSGQEFDVLPVVASKQQFGYRNKFAFPVSIDDEGDVHLGMYRKHSHDILDIENCLIQGTKTAKLIKIFKNFVQKPQIYEKFCKNPKLFKHIVVREQGDKFIMTVVVGDDGFHNFQPLVQLLKDEFKEFGLYKNVNKKDNNVIFGDTDCHIFGLTELEVSEFGVTYKVNNRSFLQVNDYVKQKVYQKILDLISGEKNVVDAYSGAGLLSAILAKNGSNCYGIEIVKEASKNAEEIKQSNNLTNLINICGDCAKELPKLAESLKGDFSLVVDPPRKGMDEAVAKTILNHLPKKIVYLSCNPATLARDIKILSEAYDVKLVQPYDMFPQTANVETLVLMEKRCLKPVQKKKNVKKNSGQKERYFAFYDDIKDRTHKVVDW